MGGQIPKPPGPPPPPPNQGGAARRITDKLPGRNRAGRSSTILGGGYQPTDTKTLLGQ